MYSREQKPKKKSKYSFKVKKTPRSYHNTTQIQESYQPDGSPQYHPLVQEIKKAYLKE